MKQTAFLVMLLLLAACASPTEQESTFTFAPASLANTEADFAARMTIALPDADGLSVEAQRSRVSAAYAVAMGRFWEAHPRLEAAPSASEQDALARTLIHETPAEGLWLMEQYVAQYMLEQLLSSEAAEAERVAFYIELLHRNDSQRTDLLVGGLTRLQSTWPQEKVRTYAAEGVARAERWLEQVGQARSGKATPGELPPQHTNSDRVAHYLGYLEALAAN